MNRFDRYFHRPFVAARAYLLAKLFLLTVALDAWTLMIGHAGRYGVDGFNVAHFGWLDRIAPLPSAALYVGVLLASGLLALALALGGGRRWALFALFLLYTFSWAMSMLDSYQHHYFVSLVLLCLVFFPELRAGDVDPPPSAAELPAPPSPAADSGMPAARSSAKQARQAKSRHKAHARLAERAAGEQRRRRVYLAVSAGAIALYWLLPAPEHPYVLFASCAAVLAVATLAYAAVRKPAPCLAEGFGFNLLGVTIAILYLWTSIAKTDRPWLDGHTITRISAAKRVFAPLVASAGAFGIEEPRFWSLLASSVVPLEMLIAITYLVAVTADTSRSRLPRWIASAGWFFAMSLHLGAEAMELEIGWFSYYMILLACGFLLPGRLVDALATVLTAPAHFVNRQLADLVAPAASGGTGTTLALAGAAALSLLAVGKQLDLPGALPACAIAAGLVIALALAASARHTPVAARPSLLATAAAAALMWLTIARSDARWDFYRFLGGDLRRRGDPEGALEAYRRGERYAPPGQSRGDQIEELRRALGK